MRIQAYSLSHNYNITVGQGVLEVFPFEKLLASHFVIIADPVAYQFSKKLLLRKFGDVAHMRNVIFVHGEGDKRPEKVLAIAHLLARKGVDRNAVIVGIGGGVVGDVSGFVASIYKRGVRLIHVPTTLLAQVDSSIGGKNGVNLAEGKNLLGTIFPPTAVIADTMFLSQLPAKELRSGLSEIIKYALMFDRGLWKQLNNADDLTLSQILSMIPRAIKIKVTVVKKDEHERGERALLNYGHTVGHAIEAITGGAVNHGAAVAIGMRYELMYAIQKHIAPPSILAALDDLLIKCGYQLTHPRMNMRLIAYMQRDKKNTKGNICIVVPSEIGRSKSVNGSYVQFTKARDWKSILSNDV
ncbi:MAG: 3-dehydroquinate synthase [Patescibacteria group bacterium]